MKVCFRCGIAKPIEQFYRHSGMSDGHLNKCKTCACADVRENRTLKREYYRQADRERAMLPHNVSARAAYAKTAAGKRSHAESCRWHNKLNPARYRARHAVSKAIRDGRLVREPCEICGNPKANAHHDDYARPLDVTWLCSGCHRLRHVELERLGITLGLNSSVSAG